MPVKGAGKEYLRKLKEKVEEWEESLRIAKTLIQAQEKAGIPSLAVWNKYYLLYSKVQAIKKAIEEALEELGGE